MAAGLATLQGLEPANFYTELMQRTQMLVDGLMNAARTYNIPFTTNHLCGMFGMFFTTDVSVRYYRQVMNCDVDRFKRFFHGMLEEGIYLAPSAFEAGFVSSAHAQEDIEATIAAARRVMANL